ncbi:siderophore-interacting protein [Cellulomonas soli]
MTLSPLPGSPTSADSSGRPAGRARPAPRRAEVVRVDRLSPSFVRVVLGGPGLRDLPTPTHADAYVKLVFLPAPLAADPRCGRTDAWTWTPRAQPSHPTTSPVSAATRCGRSGTASSRSTWWCTARRG